MAASPVRYVNKRARWSFSFLLHKNLFDVVGASHGIMIGHVTPEAADGGAIALIQNGDEVRACDLSFFHLETPTAFHLQIR